MMNTYGGERFTRLIVQISIWVYAALVLVPIAYVLLSSFKTVQEANQALSFPSGLYLENYATIFQIPIVMSGFMNSITIVVSAVAIGAAVSSLAGYVLGRRPERMFTYIYLFILSALMIPTSANLISLYGLIKDLGLMNNRLGLVLIYAASSTPFGTLLFTGFVKNIPRELDDAAQIDGCGFFQRYWLIIMPLLRPAVVTFVVISSIGMWNDFLLPLLLITSNDRKPWTLAVYALTAQRSTDWGAVSALLTVAILPLVIVFIVLQRYFYSGTITGAVK